MQTLKRGDVRELPAPIAADMKLIAAVGQRRSVREFSDQKVDASILAHVLCARAGRRQLKESSRFPQRWTGGK